MRKLNMEEKTKITAGQICLYYWYGIGFLCWD